MEEFMLKATKFGFSDHSDMFSEVAYNNFLSDLCGEA